MPELATGLATKLEVGTMNVRQWGTAVAVATLTLGACNQAPVANVVSSADAGEAEEMADNAVALAERALESAPTGAATSSESAEETSR